MNFAGAHNPCWIFRKLSITTSDQSHSIDFIELPADNQPVGIYLKEKPFTEHSFQLQTGDMIYMFSDGYHSQFGGEKKLPLKSKYFKELLSNICILPMEKQKQILETNFQDWKGENEQTDDVLVLGMKI
jgi:serine phosphatase RsbU (regulator of sigma subunit)